MELFNYANKKKSIKLKSSFRGSWRHQSSTVFGSICSFSHSLLPFLLNVSNTLTRPKPILCLARTYNYDFIYESFSIQVNHNYANVGRSFRPNIQFRWFNISISNSSKWAPLIKLLKNLNLIYFPMRRWSVHVRCARVYNQMCLANQNDLFVG